MHTNTTHKCVGCLPQFTSSMVGDTIWETMLGPFRKAFLLINYSAIGPFLFNGFGRTLNLSAVAIVAGRLGGQPFGGDWKRLYLYPPTEYLYKSNSDFLKTVAVYCN
eukprot:1507415-Amphidinium_carterae.1